VAGVVVFSWINRKGLGPMQQSVLNHLATYTAQAGTPFQTFEEDRRPSHGHGETRRPLATFCSRFSLFEFVKDNAN
jgi:hypothetical protein